MFFNHNRQNLIFLWAYRGKSAFIFAHKMSTNLSRHYASKQGSRLPFERDADLRHIENLPVKLNIITASVK